jgi:hypothetical protein
MGVVTEREPSASPTAPPDGQWNARSPRIPFVEPWPPGDPAVAAAAAPASYVLEFSTGQVVTVAGAGLIGRAPHAGPGESTLQLVSVDDPGRSVSKVHARFEVDADGLWIEDRKSGNGTAIVRPGLAPLPILPGRRHPVSSGFVVRIGLQSFLVR